MRRRRNRGLYEYECPRGQHYFDNLVDSSFFVYDSEHEHGFQHVNNGINDDILDNVAAGPGGCRIVFLCARLVGRPMAQRGRR
ncbi:MAG: hypothetical protein HKO03_06640 [Acidimicrobiia bacterium]|nr:hypothetical protein [Acidimicrobiia bacterium]